MKHFLYAGLAAALLAACEAPAWQKTGASEAMANDDAQSCHRKALVTPSPYAKPPPSPYATATVLDADDARARFERMEYRNCMQDKGYSAKR